MSAEAGTEFDRATAVAPLGGGAYEGVCDRGWWAGRGPNGGYLAAIVLRAMIAELGDAGREPRALTCHYLRPPCTGTVRVEVSVERSGRAMSSLTARMSQEGRDCILALAAFGTEVPEQPAFVTAPPAVAAPEDIEPVRAEGSWLSIVERFEARPALGGGMLAGADEALTGGWLRFADVRRTDALALTMFADAWFPSPWVRLREPVPAPTIDLTVHFRAPGAAAALEPGEPVLTVFRSSTAADGFFEEDSELWSREGVLLAQSRQLALLAPLERAAA